MGDSQVVKEEEADQGDEGDDGDRDSDADYQG